MPRTYKVPGGMIGAWIVTLLPFVYAAIAGYYILIPADSYVAKNGVDRATYEITQFAPLVVIVLLTAVFFLWGEYERRNRPTLATQRATVSREEWARQSHHIGWIDYIGTCEEFQRRGLGHALLLHVLRGLQDWGAEQAMLITTGTNATAQRAFQSVGFLPAEQEFHYLKELQP